MGAHKDIPILKKELEESFDQIFEYCTDLTEEEYFTPLEKRWNIAETIRHLILSTSPLVRVLSFPKPVIGMVLGKTKRSSLSYKELTMTYHKKLEEGGKAAPEFIPKLSDKHSMSKSLSQLDLNGKRLVKILDSWSEEQLDHYLLPHPLLGKITVREMLYFTIYHNYHHLNAVKK